MKRFEQTTTLELGGVRITVVEQAKIEHYLGEANVVVTARKSPDRVLFQVEDEQGRPRRLAVTL